MTLPTLRPAARAGIPAAGPGAILPTATAVLLLATALVPLLDDRADLLGALALVLGGLALAAWIAAHDVKARLRSALTTGRLSRLSLRPSLEMLLHLSPVALLTVVYPLAVTRITDVHVGGVLLTELLLASSLTVPWLSMAVCLPLYRAIGALMPAGDMRAIGARFCEAWPWTFLQTAPAVLLFTVPVQLVMRWPLTALLAYVVLCLLHVAFAQSLILANVAQDRTRWALAWGSYAAAVYFVPAAWYLPPLVGLLTQLVPMRSDLVRMRRPARLEHADVALDVGRGVLLGSVLWADKLFFFLDSGGHFAVTTVFLAVLPAVIAYNYYFVRLAPRFDRGVLTLRAAMENEPHRSLAAKSRSLADTVVTSISRTAFIGGCLGFFVTYLISAHTGLSVGLVTAVALASWFFLMTTLLCYKLDYIGETTQAQVLSAAHLVVCVAAFVLLPAGAALYGWLALAELAIFVAALRSCLSHWQSSEYSLFWRHATAW